MYWLWRLQCYTHAEASVNRETEIRSKITYREGQGFLVCPVMDISSRDYRAILTWSLQVIRRDKRADNTEGGSDPKPEYDRSEEL